MLKGLFNMSKTISDAFLRSPAGEFLHGKKAVNDLNTEDPESPDGPK